MSQEYIFESFLPYRDLLHLERGVVNLLELKLALQTHRAKFEEQLLYAGEFNIRALFPQVKTPWQTDQEFAKEREREIAFNKLTEAERKENMEKEADELRKKIDSGELDIWDDSPRYIEREKVEQYIKESISALESIQKACNGEKSLIEGIILKVLSKFAEIPRKEIKALVAYLSIWDRARMYYEGEPPYRIIFSKQVSEELGIDPEMEAIKMQKMSPISARDLKLLNAAERVVMRNLECLIAYGISHDTVVATRKPLL